MHLNFCNCRCRYAVAGAASTEDTYRTPNIAGKFHMYTGSGSTSTASETSCTAKSTTDQESEESNFCERKSCR